MSETLLGKESRERRLERERRELLERELLERERRDRLEKERAELLSQKEGFTIRESCHIIGAGRSTIYEALKDGELAALKLARRTIHLQGSFARRVLRRLGREYPYPLPRQNSTRPAPATRRAAGRGYPARHPHPPSPVASVPPPP